MKKLICLILAFAMLCMLGSSLAEELDLDSIEFTAPAELTDLPEKNFKENSFAIDPNADQVVCENNVYTVTTPDLVLVLDLSKNSNLICLTQDYFASLDIYMRLDDPDSLIQYLIDNKIHFEIMDRETGNDMYIYSTDGDQLSTRVGNLSSMSESIQKSIQDKIGADDIIKTGDITWLYTASRQGLGHLHTIVNGVNIIVQFGGSGDLEGDLEDTVRLLANLTLK